MTSTKSYRTMLVLVWTVFPLLFNALRIQGNELINSTESPYRNAPNLTVSILNELSETTELTVAPYTDTTDLDLNNSYLDASLSISTRHPESLEPLQKSHSNVQSTTFPGNSELNLNIGEYSTTDSSKEVASTNLHPNPSQKITWSPAVSLSMASQEVHTTTSTMLKHESEAGDTSIPHTTSNMYNSLDHNDNELDAEVRDVDLHTPLENKITASTTMKTTDRAADSGVEYSALVKEINQELPSTDSEVTESTRNSLDIESRNPTNSSKDMPYPPMTTEIDNLTSISPDGELSQRTNSWTNSLSMETTSRLSSRSIETTYLPSESPETHSVITVENLTFNTMHELNNGSTSKPVEASNTAKPHVDDTNENYATYKSDPSSRLSRNTKSLGDFTTLSDHFAFHQEPISRTQKSVLSTDNKDSTILHHVTTRSENPKLEMTSLHTNTQNLTDNEFSYDSDLTTLPSVVTTSHSMNNYVSIQDTETEFPLHSITTVQNQEGTTTEIQKEKLPLHFSEREVQSSTLLHTNPELQTNSYVSSTMSSLHTKDPTQTLISNTETPSQTSSNGFIKRLTSITVEESDQSTTHSLNEFNEALLVTETTTVLPEQEPFSISSTLTVHENSMVTTEAVEKLNTSAEMTTESELEEKEHPVSSTSSIRNTEASLIQTSNESSLSTVITPPKVDDQTDFSTNQPYTFPTDRSFPTTIISNYIKTGSEKQALSSTTTESPIPQTELTFFDTEKTITSTSNDGASDLPTSTSFYNPLPSSNEPTISSLIDEASDHSTTTRYQLSSSNEPKSSNSVNGAFDLSTTTSYPLPLSEESTTLSSVGDKSFTLTHHPFPEVQTSDHPTSSPTSYPLPSSEEPTTISSVEDKPFTLTHHPFSEVQTSDHPTSSPTVGDTSSIDSVSSTSTTLAKSSASIHVFPSMLSTSEPLFNPTEEPRSTLEVDKETDLPSTTASSFDLTSAKTAIITTETHREGKRIPFSTESTRRATVEPSNNVIYISSTQMLEQETTTVSIIEELYDQLYYEDLTSRDQDNVITAVVQLPSQDMDHLDIDSKVAVAHHWLTNVLMKEFQNWTRDPFDETESNSNDVPFGKISIFYLSPTPNVQSSNITMSFIVHNQWRNETLPVDFVLSILKFYSKDFKQSMNATLVDFYHGLPVEDMDLLPLIMEKYGAVVLVVGVFAIFSVIFICVLVIYKKRHRRSIHYLSSGKLQHDLPESVGIDLTPDVVILQDEKKIINGNNKICDDEGWLVPIHEVPLQEDINMPKVQDTKL